MGEVLLAGIFGIIGVLLALPHLDFGSRKSRRSLERLELADRLGPYPAAEILRLSVAADNIDAVARDLPSTRNGNRVFLMGIMLYIAVAATYFQAVVTDVGIEALTAEYQWRLPAPWGVVGAVVVLADAALLLLFVRHATKLRRTKRFVELEAVSRALRNQMPNSRDASRGIQVGSGSEKKLAKRKAIIWWS